MQNIKFVFLSIATLFFVEQAMGHAIMRIPTPRNNFTSNKTRALPCGGTGGGASVADTPKGTPVITYQAGAEIDVRWEETVNHAGNYEWSISSDNDATFLPIRTFPDNKLYDENDPATRIWNEKIRLPAGLTCDNCTLRMIQNMNDDPNSPYKSCADIRIVAANSNPGGNQGSQDSSSTSPGAEKPQLGGCGLVDTKGGPGAGGSLSIILILAVMMLPIALITRQRKYSYARNNSREG